MYEVSILHRGSLCLVPFDTVSGIDNASGGTRTPDRRIRSSVLSSTELLRLGDLFSIAGLGG